MLVLVTFHLSLITSLAQVDSLYHVFERQMGPLRVETGNELMQALLSEGFGDDLTFSPQTHPDTLTMTASYYAAEYFLNVRQLDRCLDALKKEGIQKVFGLVFKDNEAANAFWEQQGYSLRTNLNYRNKSLNDAIPAGD